MLHAFFFSVAEMVCNLHKRLLFVRAKELKHWNAEALETATEEILQCV